MEGSPAAGLCNDLNSCRAPEFGVNNDICDISHPIDLLASSKVIAHFPRQNHILAAKCASMNDPAF
ncbi:hypothetical protein [Caballeronia sp. AZ7_KS35]|uniref:hypothetical protein n=1 Tax=Caballeronia sp. AZ7_KS35 TaxID=2921762 RepID=UPI0020283807|nr:hypothetical protein [Caballeronia sp. AZ7_KS35]